MSVLLLQACIVPVKRPHETLEGHGGHSRLGLEPQVGEEVGVFSGLKGRGEGGRRMRWGGERRRDGKVEGEETERREEERRRTMGV